MSATLEAAECCASLSAPTLSDEKVQAIAGLFKALADPARVRIVNILPTSNPEPVCVCHLIEPLGLSVADRLASHEEAARRRAGGLRAAWQVGLLLVEGRRRRDARDCRRPERSELLTTSTADHLREQVRQRYAESALGCIAGALSKGEYLVGLETAGFEQISIAYTHPVADGMRIAIVKSVKTNEPACKGLLVLQPAATGGCC